MADDWEVGDLAQCIKTYPIPRHDALVLGRVYTVTAVCFGGRGLHLAELPCVCMCGSVNTHASWRSELFRKIKPPKKEEERFDFRALLTPNKVKELEPV